MNEELDSQLSAMFDNELPAAECELLARRLSRDEDLKARWGRYAAIGATIRAEGGVRLNSDLAIRVNRVITAEPAVIAEPVGARPQKATTPRWWMPVGGAALAASVAAAAILFLRYEAPSPGGQVAAQAPPAAASQTLVARGVDTTQAAPDSYVVPKTLPRRSIVPSTQLANYVVAHSEFSSPVNRRNLLSAFMASESGTAGAPSGSDEPTEDVSDDAKSPH
ncbi:MAG: sigma-E factor negative regulatory protein RseA [Gammaproteobacteria bacterium]|jgi:negative regulator of sigma E activity|nr:sigma-E factor negative regulatory protein RseA [Gammaproteobacteria bacterium]